MSNPNDVPDKKNLYGIFDSDQKWKTNLQRRATHKALDIADEEMPGVTTNVSKAGVTWKEILALGALLVSVLLGYGAIQGKLPGFLASSTEATKKEDPVEREFNVRFYDKDGNLIDLPQRK